MYDNTNIVTITREEYQELIAKAERIVTLERFITVNKYLNVEDIKAILGINEAKENENA